MARPYNRRHTPKLTEERPAVQEPVAMQAPAESPRPDLRADPRSEVRSDDPRARAEARAAELRGHLGSLDEGTDDYYIDPSIVPDGWSYEWKRKTVYGAEDPAYQVQLARTGWEAVPANRHPSYMPEGFQGRSIERKGMVLMERPMEITAEVQAIERRKARLQVRTKEEQLNAAPQGHFERVDTKGQPTAKVNKSFEPMAIPD